MKFIPLSQGQFTQIDDEDFDVISQKSWWLSTTGYASRTIWYGRDQKPTHKNVSLHRELLGVTNPKVLVDHINGNKLDNRRENLRLSTKSQNGCNRGKTTANTTGFKGVTKHTQCNRWLAQIRVKGTNHYLGLHPKPEDAARAYDAAAIHHFGEYAHLNNV